MDLAVSKYLCKRLKTLLQAGNLWFWQVGKFIKLMSTFVGGFAIAFARGWLLSLVLLSSIPLLVLTGGAMAIYMAKMSSRGQLAYAEAGNVVEQTVGAIRTVRH